MQRFVALIGRTPTFTELGIVSAMWNEHCSYKSSRLHLRKLPTKAPWVIQGPGENAGVIDIGDGDACVFKMESHNHPSFIEPYQGAATGVGGILRDVFTMGARPVACLNLLRFGSPEHPKTPHLVAGVVAGIGGITAMPSACRRSAARSASTSATTATFSSTRWRSASPRADAIFYAKATGVGNPIVYLGSKTGRDGIHGATMASAAFEADAEEKRPTVQVGDPFAEKLLLEACLELMASGAVIAIQDMGAAGLTSSAVEMGAKGDLGVELDLDHVPCRESGMTRLRDDAFGEPGAHADGAPSREARRGARRSSANGASISPSSARLTDTQAFRRSSIGARSRPTCRSRSSATRRRSTTGPWTPTRACARARRRRGDADAVRPATRC